MPEPSDLGRNLRRLLDESATYRGNAKQLSLDSGLGETAVRDILTGRSQKPLRPTLFKIASQLGCEIEALESPSPDPEGDVAAPRPRVQQARRGDMIPIRGAGRGGGEQEMFVDEVVGYTPRPANLEGVREAYAVYMVGTSMEPRYEQGWLLHVNPFRPPSRGRDVVVYKMNNVVMVKRFIRRSDAELILEQLNPPEEIRVPLRDVKEYHLIVGSDQEGG